MPARKTNPGGGFLARKRADEKVLIKKAEELAAHLGNKTDAKPPKTSLIAPSERPRRKATGGVTHKRTITRKTRKRK